MQDVFTIRDLQQVRLLSDPLKLQLLQAFADGAKTTKQVATELGESVTKLYRHVDALHDAGLLTIAREKQKRGTVERTFEAVARRFEVDHALFAEDAAGNGASAVRDMLRAGEQEILQAIATLDAADAPHAVMLRLRGKASPEKLAELHDSLNAWIESAQEENPGEAGEEFGALIAFYPLDSKR